MNTGRLASATICAWEKLKAAIWPRGVFCLCCQCRSNGELLCAECMEELDALRIEGASASDGNTSCVWRYDGVVQRLVLLLKLECVEDAAEVLAGGLADVAGAMQFPQEPVLTWVTMPPDRFRERAIDHGRILCQAVAKQCGLPARQLLERHGKIHTQRGLTREKRLTNLANSIRSTGRIDAPVLLIDDVLTTGATAAACTNELLRAGAPSVTVLTAAKVI